MTNEELSTKREVDWLCVIYNIQLFLSCLLGLHLAVFDAYIFTSVFSFLLVILSILGVTAGSHRLWAHRSYKASTSLKIFLMLCQTLTGHMSIYDWVRLHRLHHKFFQSDLDPYYSRKGFFHTHFIGSNFKLSPAQEKHLQEIDMSDIENDSVVMFQKKYYWILFSILTLLLPLNAPVEYWDESIINSLFIVGWLRFGITYHLSKLIYSGIEVFDYGSKDKRSFDNNLVFFITKSYWLSYHYLTPWDYQTSEYGKYGTDCTSKFIRVCAALELASDLRTVNNEIVKDALTMSITENKPVSECLTLLANKGGYIPKDHYITPSKFY